MVDFLYYYYTTAVSMCVRLAHDTVEDVISCSGKQTDIFFFLHYFQILNEFLDV